MSRHVFIMNVLAILYLLPLVHSQFLCNPSVATSASVTTSLASGTYPFIEYLKLYAKANPEFQNLADIRLQTITMMKYVPPRDSQYRLRNLFVDEKMENLASAVKRVESLFSDYVLLKKKFNKFAEMNEFLNATYESYLYKVFRAGFYGIAEMIDEIHDIMAPRFNPAQEYSDALIASVLDLEKPCYANLSRMQMLGQLLGHLAVIEAKCFLIVNFGYDIKSLLYQDDFSENKRLAEKKSIDRHNRVIRKFKPQLMNLSNVVHTCDPQAHIKGITYLEMEGLFQTYLMHEADIALFGTCSKDCSEATGMPACPFEIFRLNNPKSFCNVTYQCSTDLEACKPLLDNDYSPNPRVCISSKSKPGRRYDFVSFHNDPARHCSDHFEEASKSVNYLGFSPYKCIFCQCTCAQGNYKKAEYKFSILASSVLYGQNYVMTNARFVKRNDVFHVQVQQGKLLPYGGIDPNSIEWRSLPDEDKAEEITWKIREVELCSLKIPDGHVVVGVSLFLRDKKQFGLRVMHLPFNFSSGLLMKDAVPQAMFIDYSKEVSIQSELYLSNKNVPTHTYDNEVHSLDHQYLRFQPSDLENDGGQSTIPFIDLQEVNFTIPTPLSGVGLTHRSDIITSCNSGGFLALKLFTYNFASHLHETLILDKAIVPSTI